MKNDELSVSVEDPNLSSAPQFSEISTEGISGDQMRVLGIEGYTLLSTYTKTFENEWVVKTSNGDDVFKFHPDMTVTLVQATNPNNDITKFWITTNYRITSLGWGNGDSANSLIFTFYNAADGLVEDPQYINHRFPRCHFNNTLITEKQNLPPCDWFGLVANARRSVDAKLRRC